MSDFLEPLANTAADVVRPLRESFRSREEFQLFLNRFGWDVDLASGNLNAINAAFAIEPLITTLIESVDEFANGSNSDRMRAALDVIQAAKNAVDRLSRLNGSGAGGLGAPFDDGAFWSELAGNVVEDLIVTLLESRHPFFFALLHMIGVIRFERVTPAGAGRIPFRRSRVDWAALPTLLTRPGEQLNELYKWDVAGQNFDHERLLRTMERSLLSFGVPASVSPPRASLHRFLTPANIATQGINELEAPILESVSSKDQAFWRLGFIAMPIPDPPGSAGAPKGLLITPLLAGGASVDIPLVPDINLTISGSADGTGTFLAKIFPSGATFEADLAGTVIDASVAISGRPQQPWLIVGSRTGSRLELDGFRALLGFKGTIADPEIYFAGGTGDADSKLRLKVLFNEGSDGFVQNMVGGEEGLTVEVGANLIVSSKHGATFEGSAAFDFVKAIHLALGPISIETLYIRAMADPDGLRTDLGVGLKGSFGPLQAVVENIGVRVKLVPVPGGSGGAFGNLDVQFGFKPPNGIGLSIDAGAFKGGGYLFFDFDKEEYAGALEFTVIDFISLKAIGLLTTRMPDGSKGFSLLIILSAEFSPGIQLGYGFTLIGVGGLLGLNRTMRLQPLVEGVRTGAINGIMFPTDVVANAPRIISDLRNIFPPKEGTFLIGPMAKIGWGTPTLISLSLGVIIEIPGNVAILGVLGLILPDEEAEILVLRVNFVGAIEFDRKRVYFFAGLFDSRILFMTLEGEMGLLMAFGDDANFVLTVGGFHPQFDPPPLPFPSPVRLSINILNTPYARIRVMAYFGVTSNSVQFGARAELFFGYEEIALDAYLAFDALLRFSPFYFIIEISAGASLKVFGIGLFSIRLRFSLEGPTPWRARGSGTISILFFEISADFDETWGETQDTSLPPIPVMPLLVAEFGKPDSWRALPPPSSRLLVTLRRMEPSVDGVVLHPLGALRVGQRAVPLHLQIDKVGTQKPSDANNFTLDVQPGSLARRTDATDPFALAQFQDMSDSAKLSRPAYEPQHSGVELAVSGAQLATGRAVKRSLRYEEVVIDTLYRRYTRPLIAIGAALFSHLVLGASVCRSSLSRAEGKRRAPHDGKVEVASAGYGVVSTEDNRRLDPAARFESEALAREYLRKMSKRDPANADRLHVVPETEVAA